MKLLPILALGAALAAPATAAAQPPKLQRALDRYVATGVPGAVVLARDGARTVTYSSGRGARIRDRFRVGSITKTFVATVVLQLSAEGRLALDDTVEQHLPGLVPNGAGITIRQLLNHTSGLFNYTEDPAVFEPYLAGDFGFTWTPQQLVAMGVAHPPLAAPGDHHEYNNTGYILTGLIVEAVTGNSLREEIDARIVRPLRLKHTELADKSRIKGPHAHGYMPIDGELVDVTGVSPSWGWAAGALVSTADDVATFFSALKDGRLLGPHEMAAMRTTVPSGGQERYGLGYWRTKLIRCGAWGHDGDLPGYHADAFTHGDRVVVLLGTRSGDDGGIRTLRAGFRLLNAALCR